MRMPARFIADNVSFTYDGTAWATWEIMPPTYARLNHRRVVGWLESTTSALMSLPGESMLVGICKPASAASVGAAMRAGVDMAANPSWGELVDDTEARLGEATMYDRRVYVCAQLPRGQAGRLELSIGSAVARLSRRFRLPPLAVRASELDSVLHQADQVQAVLAGFLGQGRVRPLTSASLAWLYARAGRRGSTTEPKEERFGDLELRVAGDDGVVRCPSLISLRPPDLFEGGEEVDRDRPRHRRYLRADTEGHHSFQTMMVFTHLPKEWYVPGGGGEVLARIDECGFPVDYVVRLRPVSNHDAQRQIRDKMGKLASQYDEYQGRLEGAPPSIDLALETLRAELMALNDQPNAPEFRTTVALALGSDNLSELDARADRLRDRLKADEYVLDRPTGDQRALWEAHLPASTCRPVVHDYTQYLLPRDVAGLAPFAGCGLGDPRGGLLGVNQDAKLGSTVLFSPSYGPAMPAAEGGPRSGSIGICGRVRSGKSWLTKKLIDETLRCGGQVVITDRTNMDGVGEYGRVIPVLPTGCSHQVVRVGHNQPTCLDPMRVFAGSTAERYTTAFLTILTGTAARSSQGALIQEAVTAIRARGGSLGDVVDYWTSDDIAEADRADARELARLTRSCTRSNPLADVAFGAGTPMRLDADLILFHAPELSLPSEAELRDPDALLPDQVFSLALLYLINCVARVVAFQDRSRFSLIVVDEGYALRASPQGRNLLIEVGKDGPKHNAGLVYITHLPSEIPDELSDLLGTRFLFRMAREYAPDGLGWMQMEPSQANVELIAEDRRRSGECLMLDRYGRHGLVRIRRPHSAALAEAWDTSIAHVAAAAPPEPVRAPRSAPVATTNVAVATVRPVKRRPRVNA